MRINGLRCGELSPRGVFTGIPAGTDLPLVAKLTAELAPVLYSTERCGSRCFQHAVANDI